MTIRLVRLNFHKDHLASPLRLLRRQQTQIVIFKFKMKARIHLSQNVAKTMIRHIQVAISVDLITRLQKPLLKKSHAI